MAENGNGEAAVPETTQETVPQNDEIDRSEAKSDMNTLFILDLMRQKKEKLMRLKKVKRNNRLQTGNIVVPLDTEGIHNIPSFCFAKFHERGDDGIKKKNRKSGND